MAIRFRKSINLAPGIKANLGKKSVGFSIGGRGGGVNFNSKSGLSVRSSIPGTGISSINHLSLGENGTNNICSTCDKKDEIDKDEGRVSLFLNSKILSSLNDAAFSDYSNSIINDANSIKIGSDRKYYDSIMNELKLIQLESKNRQSKNYKLKKDAVRNKWLFAFFAVLLSVLSGLFFSGISLVFGSVLGVIALFSACISIYGFINS